MDFKCTWKMAISVLSAAIAIFAGVLAFDDRYVTAKEFARLEQNTVKSMEQFQTNQEKKFLEQRYYTLYDQEMQWKLYISKNPRDAEARENYNRTVEERRRVKEQMDKLK